jgi:hypothetical protein
VLQYPLSSPDGLDQPPHELYSFTYMSSLDITGKKKTGKGDQNLTHVDRLRNPDDRDIEYSTFSFS